MKVDSVWGVGILGEKASSRETERERVNAKYHGTLCENARMLLTMLSAN